MRPYYQDDLVTIYHGDWRDVLRRSGCICPGNDACGGLICDEGLRGSVMVTDPPYGVAYESGKDGVLARSIAGDEDTRERDDALSVWGPRPALVFGSWRRPEPWGTRMALVWDKGPALGMGALDLPWKPSWDLIFVIGHGFAGHRDGGVLYCPPVQSMAANGRTHPHEKPVQLLRTLIAKCPTGEVVDPFMGTGATLVAAKSLGRRAVGVELDESYCEVAATRCSQGVLGLITEPTEAA